MERDEKQRTRICCCFILRDLAIKRFFSFFFGQFQEAQQLWRFPAFFLKSQIERKNSSAQHFPPPATATTWETEKRNLSCIIYMLGDGAEEWKRDGKGKEKRFSSSCMHCCTLWLVQHTPDIWRRRRRWWWWRRRQPYRPVPLHHGQVPNSSQQKALTGCQQPQAFTWAKVEMCSLFSVLSYNFSFYFFQEEEQQHQTKTKQELCLSLLYTIFLKLLFGFIYLFIFCFFLFSPVFDLASASIELTRRMHEVRCTYIG